jgi:hypothetical protein
MRSPIAALPITALALAVAFSAACASNPDQPSNIDPSAASNADVGHDEDDHGEVGDLADAGSAENTADPVSDDDAGAALSSDAGKPHDAGAPTCSLLTPPHGAQLESGLHPYASDGLRLLGITSAGISQTIGNAAASAGTHAQDGTFMGLAYSAATDIRLMGRSEAQIAALLDKLASVGIAGWYRKPGSDGWPSYDAAHIHAIYVGAPMKLMLRNQVRDWMAGKNGLASHTTYKFHTWTKCQKDPIWAEFLKHNPANN